MNKNVLISACVKFIDKELKKKKKQNKTNKNK